MTLTEFFRCLFAHETTVELAVALAETHAERPTPVRQP